MTAQTFANSPLMLLRDAFPQFKVSDETMAAYEAALRDLAPQTLTRAIVDCLNRIAHFPRVAEIRQAAEKIAPPAPKSARREPLRLNWWRKRGLSEQEIDAAIYVVERRAGRKPDNPDLAESWPEAADIAPALLVETLVVA